MINARGRVSLTSETKYFCYSRVRAINYYFNGTAHMKLWKLIRSQCDELQDYVKGVVNTYPANMLKQYIERQNVTSYRSLYVDARCRNVNIRGSQRFYSS